MQEQTLELHLEPHIRAYLKELSHAGTLFYNAALQQRRENPGELNRTKQKRDLDTLYTLAEIDPLPHSVACNLLLELDVATFTPARFQERSLQHFYPLTWKSRDIEVKDDSILLQPNIRLPLPEFKSALKSALKAASGILTRVRVRTIIDDLTIIHFTWKRILKTGPGKDIERAFGYEGAEGGVRDYLEMLIDVKSRL